MFKQRQRAFQEKVVLISGVSSGLGEALADTFYGCGCELILEERGTQELQKVKDALTGEMALYLNKIRVISRRIEQHPAIWNPLDLDYANRELRITYFNEIADATNDELELDVGLTGTDVQDYWEKFRGTYSRYQRSFTRNGVNLGDHVHLATLVILRSVHFLISSSRRRSGLQNVDVRMQLDNLIDDRMAALQI
ncbi:hypothetical protein QAD02_014414 [Eretmocerus hayati]|uniref:Uncharacterized protein n=1 Tax=Eretmocerus hayati TaxID=131215 RepID=A0ACC2P842_9HYME|nr:hypothetical protein QAD02_014414 [Eretmocerus hayati]